MVSKIIFFLILILILVIGCGKGGKSASQLYEEAKVLQKEAEICLEKKEANKFHSQL